MTENSKWDQLFSSSRKPGWDEIEKFIDNPLWGEINGYLKQAYLSEPELSYSVCAAQRGWNVKYKKGGRALCTLYPEEGSFIALVVVGTKEEPAVELMLPSFTKYVQELYKNTRSMPMGRWLMIRVSEEKTLDDVITLIGIRVKPKVKV